MQIIENDAGLYTSGLSIGVDGRDMSQVTRHVHDDRCVATLAGETRTGAARQNGDAVVVTDPHCLQHVLDREHLAAGGARRIVTGDQDVFLDALALLRLRRLGVEHADDAVGVAHRGHFRVGDDEGFIGIAHGERGAALDAGRAVADDPVEGLA